MGKRDEYDLLMKCQAAFDTAAVATKRASEGVGDEASREQLVEMIDELQTRSSQVEVMARQVLDASDEAVRKSSGDIQAVEVLVSGGVIDIRDLIDPVDRAKTKWYNPRSRSSKKKGICFHHTAVAGGYGTHRDRRDLYVGKPRDWSRWLLRPGQDIDDNAYVKAMALSHRYRGDKASSSNTGVSYHAIRGGNGVLYLNLPFDWITWHGNGSNSEYLGFAWDGNSRQDEIPAAQLLADLRYVVETARREGHPIATFTCHCAWTNKPHDPGATFIRTVIEPAAKELGCTIDYDFKDTKTRGAKSLREILGT